MTFAHVWPKNAAAEGRVVITIDKDFGKHVFAEGLPHAGIIRLPNVRRTQRLEIVRTVLERHSEALQKGAIVTVTISKIRYAIHEIQQLGKTSGLICIVNEQC